MALRVAVISLWAEDVPAAAPAMDAVPPRFPLVAFAVDDLETNIERLRSHKVELPWGIEQDASSRWVMFQDPAGNLIELVQFGP